MQVYALVDAGDPEAADVFLSEADAQRALDDCLFDEPEWHGLPRVVPSSRRELSSRRTDVIAVGLRFSRRPRDNAKCLCRFGLDLRVTTVISSACGALVAAQRVHCDSRSGRGMKRAIVIVVALGLAMPTVAGAGSNLAGRTQSAAGKRISFYPDISDAINDPLGKQTPVVRPSLVPLRYDGSIVVKRLRWASWGGSVARATGVYSASNCSPSCATGHRTNEAGRVTLSSPGRVLGHEVYRCFQLTVPSDASIDGRSCIKREGKLYIYVAVKAAPKPSPAGADFYSLPGWACGMNRQEAKCEFFGPPPPGGTVSLSPSGQLALCNIPNTVPATPCDIGNPGLGTPTLKRGQQVTIQPFRCSFATSGLTLTCVVIKTGKGFVISGQSATPVG